MGIDLVDRKSNFVLIHILILESGCHLRLLIVVREELLALVRPHLFVVHQSFCGKGYRV